MSRTKVTLLATVLLVILVAFLASRGGKKLPDAAANDSATPALTVTTVTPELKQWAERLSASGSVLAWQEAIVGAEVSGLRVVDVPANIGDRVNKGDLLARFADEAVLAELHQQQAAFDEARARYREAEANAQRALQIKDAGVMSAQESQQFATSAEISKAQMKSAEARLESAKLRLRYTRVLAPDDGVISSRTATLGAVLQAGSEMFRMVRRGKLEWRADLTDSQIQDVRIGQRVQLRSGKGDPVIGTVTRISPVIDAQTRNGAAYIALTESRSFKAGMFAQGEFELGKSDALTLPQAALVVRDGYSYVYRVEPDNRVTQVKITVGRRQGDRIEVSGGLAADAKVVAGGTGFLNDGDLVRIETVKAKSAAKPAARQTQL